MGHTYSNVLTHVVFSTKQRVAMIHPEFRARLHKYMGGIARSEFGKAVAIGGTENHVHGLLAIRLDVSVAEAVRKLKCLSSLWVHEALGHKAFAWQTGYAAFSVSPDRRGVLVKYIGNQKAHHRQHTFEEEFISMLKKAGIAYDPKHVFD